MKLSEKINKLIEHFDKINTVKDMAILIFKLIMGVVAGWVIVKGLILNYIVKDNLKRATDIIIVETILLVVIIFIDVLLIKYINKLKKKVVNSMQWERYINSEDIADQEFFYDYINHI